MPDAQPAIDPRAAMSGSFSLILDLLRLGAALAVLASHAAWQGLPAGQRWWPDSLGHNAVVVFFVLSGYVIAYVTEYKERDARSYWVSRLSRIGSVALPALALTLLADRIGMALDPGFYAGGLAAYDHFWVRLAASVLLVNELWLVSIMPFSNSPYWSLCYEMAYYLLFALWCFGGRRRAWWVAAAALLVGPKILLLLPVWALGVALLRWRAGYRLPEAAGWLLWAGSAAGVLVFQVADVGPQLSAWSRGWLGDWLHHRLHFSKHFVGDYLLALLIGAHFLGLRCIAHRFAVVLQGAARPIRTAAGLTFSIYLYHLPLVFLAAIVLADMPRGGGRFAVIVALVLLVIAPLGLLTEQRKEPLRRWLQAKAPQAADRKSREVPHA